MTLKLIVKCLRNTRDRQRIGSHIPTSPTTSRTDADDLEDVEEDNEQQEGDSLQGENGNVARRNSSNNTSAPSNGSSNDTKHPSTTSKSKNLQSFTQNLESRKNSAISVELKDKEPVSRKSSLDLIKDDPNCSE